MKKLFSIALAATMALSLAGCSGNSTASTTAAADTKAADTTAAAADTTAAAGSPQAATSRQEHLQSLFLMQQAAELTLVPDFLQSTSLRQHRWM